MKNQPHYNYPPQGDYPPGNYPPGGYPPPPPPGPPPGKTQTFGLDYNLAALLCYLPICAINIILPIIWLVTEPKHNRFLRFHALQSLFLTGAAIVLYIVVSIVGGIAMAATPLRGVGYLVSLLLNIVIWLGLLVLLIVAMIKAYGNQMWKIPVIGDIAEKNS